jgi:ABC-type multidrug transport system permease subunit
VILLFPSERPLFVREYANGTYSAVAYFWSKLIMELPLSLITALITFLVCYWLEALQVQQTSLYKDVGSSLYKRDRLAMGCYGFEALQVLQQRDHITHKRALWLRK